jgi:hypothetical protein
MPDRGDALGGVAGWSVDAGPRLGFDPFLFSLSENTMIKRKAAEKNQESNGRPDRRTTVARPPRVASTRRQATSGEPHEHKLETFHGVLQDFNFSPKGGIEGFLLHSDGRTVQVNVRPEVGFAVVRGIGQNVEATVEPETATAKNVKADHPVYRLVTLTGADRKPLIFAGPGERETVTVHGLVKRINYSRHGEANGVILDSGDFIHLKPEALKRADLKVGDQLTAEGEAGMMPLGQHVVEAKTINGVAVTGKRGPRAGASRHE